MLRGVSRVVASGLLFLGLACVAGRAWNSLPDPAVDTKKTAIGHHETVVFAGGCFWGVQAVFERVKGVESATSGYAGGTARNPDYEEVSTGRTGHAESVKVVYDPSQITFGQLLKVFFSVVHDPTQLNRQGPDEGTQYRSAVFYTSDEQKHLTEAYIAQLEVAKSFPRKIVTQVSQLGQFYPAEAYHQDYFDRHPQSLYIVYNDKPKVEELKKEFTTLYVEHGATSGEKH